MNTKHKNLDELWGCSVDVKPRHFDFGSGYPEKWDTVYPHFGEWDEKKCKKYLDDMCYNPDEDLDLNGLQDLVQEAMQENERYAPMMNYIYPLPDLKHDPSIAQELIEDTNCVIVLIADDEGYPDTPYMALSGGGMDLSWDICEAYMLLGYLPPVHFCRLPAFAGKKLDKTAKWIINGCKKSCEVSVNWAKSNIRDLENTQKQLAQNS